MPRHPPIAFLPSNQTIHLPSPPKPIERYRRIAAVIRRSGGAVVAEQLAPYLDVPAPPDPTAYAAGGSNPLTAVVDEGFVLPVLTRLNGRPEVTPQGDIVYVFPDLMTSAGAFLMVWVLACVLWLGVYSCALPAWLLVSV